MATHIGRPLEKQRTSTDAVLQQAFYLRDGFLLADDVGQRSDKILPENWIVE